MTGDNKAPVRDTVAMNSGLTISFDLDGVIIQNPFAKGVFPWVREHVRGGTPALAALEQAEAERQMTAAVNNIWMSRMQEGEFVTAYDWDDILGEASRSLNGPEIPDIAGLVERFSAEEGMIEILPGAAQGLQLLREHGATIHALTNGYRKYQWPVLVALGIEHYFDTVYTPEMIGFAKPQTGAFHAIPNLNAHVGDTLVHDVLGANLAGVTSVWMVPGLPADLAPYTPAERSKSPVMREFLASQLEGNLYTRFHREADLETAAPDLVVLDVLEAAQALLEQAEN